MTDLIKFDELANTEIKNLLSEKTLRKLQHMLKPNSQAQVSYSQLENSFTKLLTTILPDEARCKFLQILSFCSYDEGAFKDMLSLTWEEGNHDDQRDLKAFISCQNNPSLTETRGQNDKSPCTSQTQL